MTVWIVTNWLGIGFNGGGGSFEQCGNP